MEGTERPPPQRCTAATPGRLFADGPGVAKGVGSRAGGYAAPSTPKSNATSAISETPARSTPSSAAEERSEPRRDGDSTLATSPSRASLSSLPKEDARINYHNGIKQF